MPAFGKLNSNLDKHYSINYIINCNIFPYLYFPHVLLLHILYIQLQTVKCINYIINCNIFPYSYFPLVLLLHILYIQLQTVKCIRTLSITNTHITFQECCMTIRTCYTIYCPSVKVLFYFQLNWSPISASFTALSLHVSIQYSVFPLSFKANL